MVQKPLGVGNLLGSSKAMEEARVFARRAARVDVPVLILGETGTGKSLLGRIIHHESRRARGPFLTVNCAGVPESLFESEFFGHTRGAFTGAREGRRGLVEQAGGGTLFLDEMGELPVSQQAKLLTALEDGEVRPLGGEGTVKVDVRVIAATARDLPSEVEAGSFRRDLFHRLAVLACCLPPLRERREDIVPLARRLLRQHRRRHGCSSGGGLSDEVRHFLEAQPWPGNVRELSHLLEAGLIYAGDEPLTTDVLERAGRLAGRSAGAEEGASRLPTEELSARDRPRASGDSPESEHRENGCTPRYAFRGTPEEERALIRATLARCGGNRSRAARELGMARNTLRRRLARYGL